MALTRAADPVRPSISCLLLLAAFGIVFAAPGVSAQVIRGRVIESGSGRPVPLARVAALDSARHVAGQTRSDAEGRFRVDLARGGRFRLDVGRTGYREMRSIELEVGPTDTLEIELHLAERALRLETITVSAAGVARRVRELGLSGSYRRPRAISSAVATDSAAATGGRGRVRVEGRFAAPDDCHHLQGSVSTGARTVEVTIEATPTRHRCPAAGGALLYESTVSGLAPGSYLVRVVHGAPGARDPRIVFTGTLTVR